MHFILTSFSVKQMQTVKRFYIIKSNELDTRIYQIQPTDMNSTTQQLEIMKCSIWINGQHYRIDENITDLTPANKFHFLYLENGQWKSYLLIRQKNQVNLHFNCSSLSQQNIHTLTNSWNFGFDAAPGLLYLIDILGTWRRIYLIQSCNPNDLFTSYRFLYNAEYYILRV